MIDTKKDNDKNYENDEYPYESNIKSTNSCVQNDDDESPRRTSSSLNNYIILPPIKSDTRDNHLQQQSFIKNLQEKYQQSNSKNETFELGNDAKLDDAFLKMKRLDKALEEAFEKEKQVKIETMSLMKKLRNEMQTMTITLNSESNESSHTQTNLKRFLALDDEILKFDGCPIEDDNFNPTESIFKTQVNDSLGDSSNTNKIDKESIKSSTKNHLSNQNKKSSISSNSTCNSKDKLKKTKIPEKDFIKRNIELAKELGGTWALTDNERQRLNQLLNEDNILALSDQQINGYMPSTNDHQRLKEIDELLEKEYYNPLLNHQLRRDIDIDISIDYDSIQQVTNEENEQMDDHFGDRILKETRLQREHMQRLKKIDEQLECFHRPINDKKIEAILSNEQLDELLGQCAVDEMKQHFSFLNRDKPDYQGIDFNDLSDYTLTHYAENNRGPLITDEIIQLLINEAQQEGITMCKFIDEDEEDIDSLRQQQADSLSLAPAIDRPPSSTSTSSHIDLYNRNLY